MSNNNNTQISQDQSYSTTDSSLNPPKNTKPSQKVEVTNHKTSSQSDNKIKSILLIIPRGLLKILKLIIKSFAFAFGGLFGFFALITFLLIVSGVFAGPQPTQDYAIPNQELDFSYFSGSQDSDNQIARLELSGPVVDPGQGGGNIFMGGSFIDGLEVKNRLFELADEDKVKGVFIDLTTPGGSPASSVLINEGIDYYKNKTGKPVYTYVQTMSTSAGSYLSANSSKIFASEMAIVGNIGAAFGTILRAENVKETLRLNPQFAGVTADKITVESIFEGKYKRYKDPLNPTKEEVENFVSPIAKDLYQKFVDVMVEGRGIDRDTLINEVGARPVIAKTEGLKYKFVDQISTREQAIEALASEVGIKDDFIVLNVEKPATNPLESIIGFSLLESLNTSQKPDPRESLCTEGKALFYYGSLQDLCSFKKQ